MNKAEAGRLGALKVKELQHYKKQQRINEYNKNPKLCLRCGTPLTYKRKNRKFCNSSCAASYNDTIYPKRIKQINTVIRKYKRRIPIKKIRSVLIQQKNYCITCKKETVRKNAKFCSSKCHHIYKWNEFKKQVEHDEIVSHRRLRKYLLEKEHACFMCGIDKWLGKPILLILDHKDGDSENTKLSNCRLICSNCDATLSTYKSKNRNCTRSNRRERYHAGLTY